MATSQPHRPLRDAEADRVADLCDRLVGNVVVRDDDAPEKKRPCRFGDIALLAPAGTDLWRFEQALEDRGIPVSTQAGKGFFRRQEVHDLIALTRALADGRDTLALGALLRGPLVGLTESELLDIVEALPPIHLAQIAYPASTCGRMSHWSRTRLHALFLKFCSRCTGGLGAQRRTCCWPTLSPP